MAAAPTDTTTPRRRRGLGPIPHRSARRLQALNRAIKAGEAAANERALVMMGLREEGFSFDAIADGAGLNRESVRKAVLRRTPTGYPADAARRANHDGD